MTIQTIKTIYKITNGTVLGELWGGGIASYPAQNFDQVFDSMQGAIDFVNCQQSLDGGCGFQNELGAVYEVDTIREIELDGLVYCNVTKETVQVGQLDFDQYDLLLDLHYSN